jgi:hypothetical protein
VAALARDIAAADAQEIRNQYPAYDAADIAGETNKAFAALPNRSRLPPALHPVHGRHGVW